MENQELLNPDSDNNKKEQGVENLNPEQEQQNPAEAEPKKPEETEQEPAEAEQNHDVTVDKKADDVVQNQEAEMQAPGEETKETEVAEDTAEAEVKVDEPGVAEDTAKAEVKDDEPGVAEDTAEAEVKVDDPGVVEDATEAEAKVDEPEVAEGSGKEQAPESVTSENKEKIDDSAEPEQVKKEEEANTPVEETSEKQEDTNSEKNKEKVAKDSNDNEAEDLTARYNSLSKEELVEAIESLVENDDINQIRKHIGFIKVSFRNYLKEENVKEYEQSLSKAEDQADPEQAVEKPVDALKERFDKAFAVYKQKKYVYDQALEKQKQENLQVKETILEELRLLIESEEELKKTYDIFKELQDKWREIGPVPQGAKNTLWNNYHFLVEKFFDKVKINKELRDLDLRKNLEAKAELCEKAEELLLESSVNKSFQSLQKLHEAWKETGPVPKDKKDEIWDRFKAASDSLNERRQEYYDSLREEQNKNYSAKILLCEQAEQISDFSSDSPRKWQEATDKVNELFKVWKTIGFAPKKVNDEVWVRFRTALDTFFKNKKDFFFKYKEDQTENYNQKLNLCMQAEALRASEDWKQTTDELITLQQQWKKIGPVPKKFSDKIWKRFRAACDEFFNRKADYFSNIGEKQEENLVKKKELIETVKNYEYSKDSNENLNTLKDFQRQWMEIGHVPIKEKDKVQNEFRKVVNEQFDKLNISRKVKSAIGFKNKIENLKNSPNADNIIYKEKNFLVNKISGLQNDIKLWENNIGFFASSKKADVLKAEFENKIEKAKTDIAVLEEKLKILNAS